MQDIDQLPFTRWWTYQLKTYDCDPAVYVLKYITQRMELNVEQRYWLSWLFANTYQLPTAWVIFNEFPDWENVDVDRLEDWEQMNKSRLPYQKDQKWSKGHLTTMLRSYDLLGCSTQEEFFRRHDDFNTLWAICLKEWHKFGRFSTWNYFQALNAIGDMHLNPTGLNFHHESAAMPRGGLALAIGKPEWAEKGRKFTAKELDHLEACAYDIVEYVDLVFGGDLTVIPPDYYTLETALCSFRKFFRRKQGRYLGYYLDRYAEDISKVAAQGWDGINWDLLWESRSEVLFPELVNPIVDKSKMNLFLDTGHFLPPCSLRDRLDNWYTNMTTL